MVDSPWIQKNLKGGSPLDSEPLISRSRRKVKDLLRERVARVNSIPHLFKLLEKVEEDSEIILQKIATLANFDFTATELGRSESQTQGDIRRKVAIKRATPSWLTKEHKQRIKQKFEIAKRLTETTGIPHVVDHIVPVQGENISGLHVPWNMQVITRRQNAKKSNKFPYDVLDMTVVFWE
tara:strand:- start:426 stop:965 length:540 start_codon:yes stop_codon:yes gene_type:complete